MSWLVRTSVTLAILAVTFYAWSVWQNNRSTPMPDKQQIAEKFDSAVVWLVDHQDALLATNNPALWWMIQNSARLSGDQRLQSLFSKYHKRYEGINGSIYLSLWFTKGGWAPVRYDQISSLYEYQQFFAYALTCDQELAEEPLIAAQTDAGYCGPILTKPSCVTHQLIGFMLLENRGCGDRLQLKEGITVLQQRVRDQLVWDPRVTDPYTQRVLMLLVTGAPELLKPIWIERVIEAAREDGGWPSNRELIDLPGSRDLLMTRHFMVLGSEESSFHATAQGLLIMALLMNAS